MRSNGAIAGALQCAVYRVVERGVGVKRWVVSHLQCADRQVESCHSRL
jgi:hypothetical protein